MYALLRVRGERNIMSTGITHIKDSEDTSKQTVLVMKGCKAPSLSLMS